MIEEAALFIRRMHLAPYLPGWVSLRVDVHIPLAIRKFFGLLRRQNPFSLYWESSRVALR
jgi:hypothetical protein